MRLVIISGRSGSGKTIALHALEDLGFYCIDNLPFAFLPELESHVGKSHPLVAVSIDARNAPDDPAQFENLLDTLRQAKKNCEIVYVDASEAVLLKRFSETRRKHPLTNQKITLKEAIQKEKNILAPIATLADLIIDTSTKAPQELYQMMRDRIAHHQEKKIQLMLLSFGFKYGVPSDADFIFDVRCLPNPYWKPALRTLSGLEEPVIEFLESIPESTQLLEDISGFIQKWIPHFEADNRSYITVAIGCTGGQHRSVYMVESMAKKMSSMIHNIQTRHRELKTKPTV